MRGIIHTALWYAEMGYAVLPCAPGRKVPVTEHGLRDATTDSEQVTQWWTRHPDANVAIRTDGLLVIDVDGEGNAWLSDAPDKLADLEAAPLSLTPHAGRQYFFRQPKGRVWRNTAGRLAQRVDTRANGGYVLVAPSIVDGKTYQWADDRELTESPQYLPEPPAWLIELLDTLATSSGEVGTDTSANAIPEGQRNTTLARLAGSMRRHGMSRDEILAAIQVTNQTRCQSPLPDAEVERIATSVARYAPDAVSVSLVEDHYEQIFGSERDRKPAGEVSPSVDPGPLPDELLRVPGFVSEVMDHCLTVAPYPNTVMAFSGALALQAVLAGRKVRDPGDNRTNLYLLGLAHSSAGKDSPRKINTEILHAIGLADCLGGRFASGEGVQDALFTNPCMLFQTDEIDGILQSINKAKDARHENIMSTLLTMYSSANSVFPMRRKAGNESPGVIDQPCLVILGTAIPNHYYEALSERMLTNGFFARMIILECGKRSPGQEPRIEPLPARVLETAKWWADFRPGNGNLEQWHPIPKIVPHTDEARDILIETRLEAEAEYAKAENAGDPVGTTVWGRVSEHARKLALLYAVSENHERPEIGKAAAEWGRRFVVHQTRRMLFMAQAHVADNPFHAECLKLMQKLRDAPGRELPHSVLLKRMKMDAKSFAVLLETLSQQGAVEIVTTPTAGRHSRSYRLVEGETSAGGET